MIHDIDHNSLFLLDMKWCYFFAVTIKLNGISSYLFLDILKCKFTVLGHNKTENLQKCK